MNTGLITYHRNGCFFLLLFSSGDGGDDLGGVGVVAGGGGVGVVDEVAVLVLDADAAVGVAGLLPTVREQDLDGAVGVLATLKRVIQKKVNVNCCLAIRQLGISPHLPSLTIVPDSFICGSLIYCQSSINFAFDFRNPTRTVISKLISRVFYGRQ